MKLLDVKNIKKSFGELEVLKDISLSVEESEVISILGPSGSGKSTFLRCLAMLETIDGGSMNYCGKDAVTMVDDKPVYASKKDLKEIQGYFGMVFQNFNLFPHFNIIKNVADAAIHVQKRDKEEAYSYALETLKSMGLEDKAEAYPHQLSGGQQQRVAIARALELKPQMLFFDEPTSALDPEITVAVLKILKELAQAKKTMIIVTHEIDFARSVSDRIVFMDGGVIVEQGTPEEVLDHPKNERTKAFLKNMEL